MALKWLRRRHKSNLPRFALACRDHLTRSPYETTSIAAAAPAAIAAAAPVAAAPAIAGAGRMARAGIMAASAVMLSAVCDVVDGIARPGMIAGPPARRTASAPPRR